MSLDKWANLEARMDRLERENRRLRAGCWGCSLALICVVTMGQVNVKTAVEAQKFILRSTQGKVLAELTTLDGDYPILSLRSPNGEKEVEVSSQGLSLFDHSLPSKLPLAHYGSIGLYLSNAKGNIVLEVGGAGANAPQLSARPEIAIFNAKGSEIWRIP
jgi:hypothetical protein